MHVVIDELCTGCELCVPVCPVDCIAMIGASGERTGWDAWDPTRADEARARYARHGARVTSVVDADSAAADVTVPPSRHETIAAVLARARAARASR